MLIPPERLDEEPNILQRIRRGERVEHYETIRRRKDSTLVEISLSVSPIVDSYGQIVGASKIAQDITLPKAVERKLRESEERFRTMADSSPIMIWRTDAAGKTSFLNRTYRNYCGIAADETVNFDWPEIVHPDDRDAYVAAFLTALQQRQTFQQRVRLRRRDGQWRWFDSRANPMIDGSGNISGFVGSSVDITEIYESQQALEELSRRKDEFLATLSHELRNPLAPIRNAVEILKSVRPGESKFEWCRDLIEHQVGHMARLMEDLLDLSRITRNNLELRKQLIDLSIVIRDAIETSRPLIETGQHRLTVDLPTNSIPLDGDPTRLMQLFANLLNNAAKYMEPKGDIHLTAKLVPPAAPGGAQQVIISVRDTGIGIAPELLPHLFDMFFQAESGKERRFGGLGIGLTLARSIVELHGGSIEVVSDGPGKGSEFSVRLPLPEGRSESERVSLSVANAGNPNKLSTRVLVVDDNMNHVESIAMLLKILGCEVRTAHGGPSALKALTEFSPEFALIDIGLPGIDGFELARRIRKMNAFKNIILIAQTGWGSDEDREESRQAGFNYHLIKPLDFQVLEMILTGNASNSLVL
jgi:two-component system CheB/CheR fusion protein